LDLPQACLDCPLWQPLRGPTSIHMMFPTDLPHYPQLASAYFPNYPTKFSSKPKYPSIALCIPFARGSCHLGEDCRLHHIDVSSVQCKYNAKGVCKFGSCCVFKHENRNYSETSDLSPLIQNIVLENTLLSERISRAEAKITLLEQELAAMNCPSKATERPSKQPCSVSSNPPTTSYVAPTPSQKYKPPQRDLHNWAKAPPKVTERTSEQPHPVSPNPALTPSVSPPSSKPTTISHSASLVRSHLDASTPQKHKPPSRGQAKFDRPKKQRAKNPKEYTPELCNDFSFSLQHESVVDSRFLSTNPWKALEVTEEEPQLLPPKCLKLNLRPPLEPLECVEIPTPPSQSPSPIPLTSTPSSKPTPSPLDSTVVPTLLRVAEPKAAARRSPRKQFPIVTCKVNKQWIQSMFFAGYTIHKKRL